MWASRREIRAGGPFPTASASTPPWQAGRQLHGVAIVRAVPEERLDGEAAAPAEELKQENPAALMLAKNGFLAGEVYGLQRGRARGAREHGRP